MLASPVPAHERENRMATKRKVRKTTKKPARKSVSRKNVAGARPAPKRSTKVRRKKKSTRRLTTTDKALATILKAGMD